MPNIFMPNIINITTLIVWMTCSAGLLANDNTNWHHKKAAIVLTYDDSLNVHLDKVIPALDQYNFKATFYLTLANPPFQNRMSEWKNAAERGYELGNHTLFHPCNRNADDREWVSSDYDLSTYSVQRMLREIRFTNAVLSSLDKRNDRTFAYTCGDQTASGKSFNTLIKKDFVAARGITSKIEHFNSVDLFNVGAFVVNNVSGKELIAIAKKALQENGLAVFLFHGVGGEHNLNVSLEAHQQLINYLAENEEKYWVTTMRDAAIFMKSAKSDKKISMPPM